MLAKFYVRRYHQERYRLWAEWLWENQFQPGDLRYRQPSFPEMEKTGLLCQLHLCGQSESESGVWVHIPIRRAAQGNDREGERCPLCYTRISLQSPTANIVLRRKVALSTLRIFWICRLSVLTYIHLVLKELFPQLRMA